MAKNEHQSREPGRPGTLPLHCRVGMPGVKANRGIGEERRQVFTCYLEVLRLANPAQFVKCVR